MCTLFRIFRCIPHPQFFLFFPNICLIFDECLRRNIHLFLEIVIIISHLFLSNICGRPYPPFCWTRWSRRPAPATWRAAPPPGEGSGWIRSGVSSHAGPCWWPTSRRTRLETQRAPRVWRHLNQNHNSRARWLTKQCWLDLRMPQITPFYSYEPSPNWGFFFLLWCFFCGAIVDERCSS